MIDMMQTRKRWWMLVSGLIYFLLLALSARLHDLHVGDTQDSPPASESLVHFLNQFEAAVWFSDDGRVWVKDATRIHAIVRTFEGMTGGLKVPEMDFTSSQAPVVIVAESYACMTALAFANEHPEWCSHLVLIDAKGLPAFETLGHPLLDRSLRSLQGGIAWMLRHGVPFAWALAPSLVETKLAAAIVASGSVPSLLDTLDLQMPVSLWVSQGQELEQSRVLHRWIPHSRLMRAADEERIVPDLTARVEITEPHQVLRLTPNERAEIRNTWVARHELWQGRALWVAVVLIALSTLMSEDLACVGAGLLVSHGALAFLPAVGGCVLGIFFGDIALYALGRFLGEKVLIHRPFCWMLSRETLLASERWFLRNGIWVLIASRFLPGTRVPVFLAAGILKSPWWRVSAVLLGAAVVWVPLLVGLSSWLGERMLHWYDQFGFWTGWMMLAAMIALVTLLHQGIPLFTFRGRRLAYGKWMRVIRWEFWPSKLLYLPVFVYIMGLAVRYRSLTLPSLSNPMVPCGGWLGESKIEILRQLADAGVPVAPFAVLEPHELTVHRLRAVMEEQGWQFPVVIKPERGERGRGVCIVRSESDLDDAFHGQSQRLIVQQYVAGIEFGVLYRRLPMQSEGCIPSITRKLYTSVVGDGVSTLERLILKDERAVCYASSLLKQHAESIYSIPADGERVPLVEIGTHARGSLFLDAGEFTSDALRQFLDRVSHAVHGFYLGRFDLKVPDESSLTNGESIQILELNLLTSEPAHMYDPKYRVWHAWRLLMEHWRSAFEIGDQVRKGGGKPIGILALLRLVRQHYLS